MIIRDAKVEWNEKLPYEPELIILVDRIPQKSELLYQIAYITDTTRLYYSIHEGFVSYLYEDDRNRRGYGGAYFPLTVKDVGYTTIKGPWSSRASVVYKLTGSPVIDVLMTNSKEDFDKGVSLRKGAITLGLAIKAAAIADVILKGETFNDESSFVVRLKTPDFLHQLPAAQELLIYAYKDTYHILDEYLVDCIEKYFFKYYGDDWRKLSQVKNKRKGGLH